MTDYKKKKNYYEARNYLKVAVLGPIQSATSNANSIFFRCNCWQGEGHDSKN